MHSWLLRWRAVRRVVYLLPLLLEEIYKKNMWIQEGFVTFTTFWQMVLYVHKENHLLFRLKKIETYQFFTTSTTYDSTTPFFVPTSKQFIFLCRSLHHTFPFTKRTLF